MTPTFSEDDIKCISGITRAMPTFLGIDFSGGARPWRHLVRIPTVWIAFVEDIDGELLLRNLLPVQALEGPGSPFDRLTALLRAGHFEAATIDAPFSLPVAHLSPEGHGGLLRHVRDLPNGPDRPFPM